MDPAEKALQGFAALSAEDQERIRTEGMAIGDRVASHVLQVLYGPLGGSADPSDVHHSSAVALEVQGKLILATADHVFTGFCEARKASDQVGFQFGNALMDPRERLIWRDSSRDLVLLEMRLRDIADIPSQVWQVPHWPPQPPEAGAFVAFAGYPAGYRQQIAPRHIDLSVVGGMMQVTSRSVHNIKCVLPREHLVPIKGPHVPPPGTQLGGMSGGPVFHALGGTDLELVGVITDFGDFLDMFWMATFVDVAL